MPSTTGYVVAHPRHARTPSAGRSAARHPGQASRSRSEPSTSAPTDVPPRASSGSVANDGIKMLVQPVQELLETVRESGLWRPAEVAVGAADVAHEDALVARTPVVERVLEPMPKPRLEQLDQLEQGQRIRGAAADVVRLAGGRSDRIDGCVVRGNQVVDEQHVSHLPAIAVNRDR